MPICNTVAMTHHLREISSQVASDAYAVVILDGAAWHRSQGLVVPDNITLLELPPYSPERCADFLVSFRHHITNAFDCAGI